MGSRAVSTISSLEREVVSIFANCVGPSNPDDAATSLTYENLADPDVPFVVGETVTETTSSATGVVLSNDGSTLVLADATGTFTGGEVLTGGTSGAVADGLVDTHGTYYYNPTSVKGAGIASITAAGFVATGDAGKGVYVVTLDNKWGGLLNVAGTVMDATSPDDWEVTLSGQPTSVASHSLTVVLFKGGAVDFLTTDDKLFMEITVSNAKGGTVGELAGYSNTQLA